MKEINGVFAVFKGNKCERIVGAMYDIYEIIDEIDMEYSIRVLYDAEDRGRLLTKDEIEILTLAFAK